MNTQKDDKWLDELISHSINTTKPQFHADEWKRKHPEALQSLLSRRAKKATSDQSHVLRRIVAHPGISGLAAAAAIVVVSGLWLTRDKPIPGGYVSESPNIAQSPTSIVSMISLRTAYQTGGWDALDQQLQETLDTFGPGPSSVPVQRLLEGLKGSEI